SKGYWNKLIYDDTSCLKASTPIYNDSFSVFIMIKDRFSYRQTLKNFIHILYNNSKQLKNQPELVLFDFNSHIPVQIPSPYNNISKYPHIKLIRFDCLIPCISKDETCNLCLYPYHYFNCWVALTLSLCHLKYDRIIHFENDLYPNNLFNLYNYIGPQSWTFRTPDKYYTFSFSTTRKILIEFLYVLPDFLVEDADTSLGSDQPFIYYTNLTRCPEYLLHLEHEGGMKDGDPVKSRIRSQWRLYLYLQRYGNPSGGNIQKGGIGGNNQKYYCNDKNITCNLIFRKFISFWELYCIRKNDIIELSSFVHPPRAVKLFMETVCILFKQNQPHEWRTCQHLLRDINFLQMLVNFDYENGVSDEIMQELKSYIDQPEFQPETVGNASASAKSICNWVHAIYEYQNIKRSMV
ncbi:unnamed protein product, partial [Didymodactylos carnosus]